MSKLTVFQSRIVKEIVAEFKRQAKLKGYLRVCVVTGIEGRVSMSASKDNERSPKLIIPTELLTDQLKISEIVTAFWNQD